MTKQMKHPEHTSAFGLWLRQQADLDSRRAGLSIHNVDWVVHRYNRTAQTFLLLEEKCQESAYDFNSLEYAQRDTLSILDQMLQSAHGKLFRRANGILAPVRYGGYHVLTFENSTPDDGAIFWDGVPISTRTLKQLLSMDINPFLRDAAG